MLAATLLLLFLIRVLLAAAAVLKPKSALAVTCIKVYVSKVVVFKKELSL